MIPSPLSPQQGCKCQVLFDLWSPSFSTIWTGRSLDMSILLAKTRTGQLAISGCSMTLSRDSLAREMRSQSDESRTQMMALDPLQQWCHSSLSLVCPPMSQTVKLSPRQLTSSTLNPTVGTEATVSLSFIWQRMVVLPAPSNPSISILAFMSEKELSILQISCPIQLLCPQTPPSNLQPSYTGSYSESMEIIIPNRSILTIIFMINGIMIIIEPMAEHVPIR